VSVEPPILLGRPCLVVAPFLKTGLGALWQVQAPSGLERGPGSFETFSPTVFVLAVRAARIEAEVKFKRLRGVRDARPFHDHANSHAGKVDVPGFGPIVDALAGKGGHTLLKRRRKWQTTNLGDQSIPMVVRELSQAQELHQTRMRLDLTDCRRHAVGGGVPPKVHHQ